MSPLDRSLGARLFVLTGALVLGTMLVAIGFTALRSQQVADEWVRETLADSRAAHARFEQQRLTQLRLVSRLVAGDPSFVAYVAEGDPASVRDLLLERQRELGCDFAAVLDSRGRTLARTDAPGHAGEDLSGHPLVAEVLRRGEASGLWNEGEHFWTAAAVPLVSGADVVVGILMTGLAVDDALALDVRRASGVEIAYVAPGSGARVVASTLGDDRELLAALGHGGLLGGGPGGAGVEPARIALGGRSWIAQATPLEALVRGASGPGASADSVAAARPGDAAAAPASAPGAGRPALVAVTLASLDRELAPFRRIEGALLMVGLLSLLGSFALSWAMARRVSRPVVQLANAADAAREGRYDQPLPAAGADEVGRLSRALTGLLRELREEREMAGYLQMLSRTLPEAAPPAHDAQGLPAGTVLGGRFEILGCLGAGGMGVVYRARDRQLRDVVALKTLRPAIAAPETLEELKNELRVARRITHRNVLRTHDFGIADGTPFISMELVRGVTVRGLLGHTGRLPVAVALRLARELLAGLDAAHAMGVVHRDIKPENLILEPAGQLKVMDFGIARAGRGPVDASRITGTLGYLAPEQLQGEPGDARSDLYACGVVMYEMLAGRRPFPGSERIELSYRVMNEDPPPLRSIAPEVPAPMADAIMRCLARDPAARFGSAAELSRALEAVAA